MESSFDVNIKYKNRQTIIHGLMVSGWIKKQKFNEIFKILNFNNRDTLTRGRVKSRFWKKVLTVFWSHNKNFAIFLFY